jgi:hypothetical protein
MDGTIGRIFSAWNMLAYGIGIGLGVGLDWLGARKLRRSQRSLHG